MPLCNLVCGIVILLLIVAGIAYLLGADSLGEFALDMIRLIIVIVLIIFLIGLILLMIGYVSWPGLPFGFMVTGVIIYISQTEMFTCPSEITLFRKNANLRTAHTGPTIPRKNSSER